MRKKRNVRFLGGIKVCRSRHCQVDYVDDFINELLQEGKIYELHLGDIVNGKVLVVCIICVSVGYEVGDVVVFNKGIFHGRFGTVENIRDGNLVEVRVDKWNQYAGGVVDMRYNAITKSDARTEQFWNQENGQENE